MLGWKRILVAFLMFLVAAPVLAASSAGSRPEDLFLVIGNNFHTRDPNADAVFAEEGAKLWARHLSALSPGATLKLLVPPPTSTDPASARAPRGSELPTRAAFDGAIDALALKSVEARAQGRTVRLLLYYCGFGDQSGNLHLRGSMLTPLELMTAIKKIQATNAFLVLDGIALQRPSTGGFEPPPVVVPLESELPGRPANLGYLGISTGHQMITNGLGSLAGMVALSGLLGPADLNRDQLISFFEWRQFVLQQLDLERPLAPVLRMGTPRANPAAVVVDLNFGPSSRIVISGVIASGVIEVLDAKDGLAVARWRHYADLRQSVSLPPGKYRFVRWSDRTSRQVRGLSGQVTYVTPRVYPCEELELSLSGGQQSVVDLISTMEKVFWVPEGREGEGPKDAAARMLTPEQEVRLLAFLFKAERREELELPRSTYLVSGRLDAPLVAGRSLSGGGAELEPTLSVGEGVRVTRLLPRGLGTHWFWGHGFFFEYTVAKEGNVPTYTPDGVELVLESSTVQQFRLGMAWHQTQLGRKARVDLDETIGYGPQWTVDRKNLVGGSPVMRLVSLTEIVTDVSGAILFTAGNHLEVGPQAGLRLSFFHQEQPDAIRMQAFIGVQIRPRLLE